MEKTGKRKRVRLSYEQQQKIVADFVSFIEDRRFDVKDVISFMEKNFPWFEKLATANKNSRALDLIKVMAKTYGETFQKVSGAGGGKNAKCATYVISDEKVEIVKNTVELTKIEKFYRILREALKAPKLGISKVNVAKIMEYKSEQVNAAMLESINNEIERICGKDSGFRPLVINRDHTFTDYDVVRVFADDDKIKEGIEEANMILEYFLEKMGGEEPEEIGIDPTYHNEVKATIKKDYNLALMFKTPSGTGKVLFKGGEGHRLMRSIMGTVTIGADIAAEKYQETLSKRYGIDEYFIGISRKGFEVLSEELLNKALIAIEDKYVEFFCEEIVPHEKSILEETRKSSAEVNEDAVLRIIETDVFNSKSGGMFLHELWKHLDQIGIKRGWNLKGLLMANSDKFQIKGKNVAGYMEDYVRYTAPIPEEPEEEPNNAEEEEIEIHEDEQEDFNENVPQQQPSTETQPIPVAEEETKREEYLDVLATFEERLDIEFFCKGQMKYREIKKHRDEYVVKLRVDKRNKKEVLALLKVHCASLRSDKVDLFIEYDDVQELESIILS